VKVAGGHLVSYLALAQDQDGYIRVGNLVDDLLDPTHLLSFANEGISFLGLSHRWRILNGKKSEEGIDSSLHFGWRNFQKDLIFFADPLAPLSIHRKETKVFPGSNPSGGEDGIFSFRKIFDFQGRAFGEFPSQEERLGSIPGRHHS
jgi:hypothetical protein